MTETAFEFPCRFPVKAMTRAGSTHIQAVVDTVGAYVPVNVDEAVSVRDSRNGRYQAVTIVITAESRDQLDHIYAAVNALDAVLMTL